jgi:hypothetical protein
MIPYRKLKARSQPQYKECGPVNLGPTKNSPRHQKFFSNHIDFVKCSANSC